MQNIKYHLINITSIIIFSYISALTINQVVKYNISPVYSSNIKKAKKPIASRNKKDFKQYSAILESGFFKLADQNVGTDTKTESIASSVDTLVLLGTVTGPWSIARAMIKKRGSKDPEIFRLGSDVYGSKLIAILNTKVYLRSNGEKTFIELYGKDNKRSDDKQKSDASGGKIIKRNVSLGEIKQKVLNNLDNAMRGLVAGPYRENGVVVGFQLKKVRPYNILYKLGARNGDIVKRVNGHAIDSTQKLYTLWESLKNESKISIDLERNRQLLTFDLNITD